MNAEIGKALIALVITGIIGGIIKVYLDYKSKLMGNIWENRLEAYMKFVRRTALFPKYPRKEVRWKEVFNLSMDFRDWYFEGYGLVLSTKIRDNYFDLQEYILIITKEKIDSEQKLDDKEYDDLRERCSNLRSLMAKELESRESPIWYRFTKEPKA